MIWLVFALVFFAGLFAFWRMEVREERRLREKDEEAFRRCDLRQRSMGTFNPGREGS